MALGRPEQVEAPAVRTPAAGDRSVRAAAVGWEAHPPEGAGPAGRASGVRPPAGRPPGVRPPAGRPPAVRPPAGMAVPPVRRRTPASNPASTRPARPTARPHVRP